MKARRVVVVLVFALLVYFVLIGYRGVYLLSQPELRLKAFGAAVLVLPLIGAWVVVAEIRFGAATERLAALLNQSDGETSPAAEPTELAELAEPDLPRRPSGRVDRKAADEFFAVRQAEVESDPDAWAGWYRLAEAYDLAGDRKRAREAMRNAIEIADRTRGAGR